MVYVKAVKQQTVIVVKIVLHQALKRLVCIVTVDIYNYGVISSFCYICCIVITNRKQIEHDIYVNK